VRTVDETDRAAGAVRSRLAALARDQARSFDLLGSPFYRDLYAPVADDIEAGGPSLELLAPLVDEPFGRTLGMRLLGGVHRLVLEGEVPELAAHYPSVGGDGDAEAAWPVFRELLETRPEQLAGYLRRAPQTNEVGRCAALTAGFLRIAASTGRPLRLLELGASGGLNLRFDRYWYSDGELGFGDERSPVRFVDLYDGAIPDFGADCRVTERRGCDPHPVDPTTEDGRLTLLSYVWPDQHQRFELLRHALDVAGDFPVTVDEAGASEWLEQRLAEWRDGTTTVVFHSVVWGYLAEREQARVWELLDAAGMRATADSPLAWLRLEPTAYTEHAELWCTTWPGNDERMLATSGFHLGRVNWLVH